MRIDDPWHDALASGWADETEDAGPLAAPPRSGRRNDPPEPPDEREPHGPYQPHAPCGPPAEPHEQTAVYLAVQRSAAFQRVRSRYRRFVLPASAAFLLWYLAYLVAATAAPGLMARPVAGVLNVAMAACLAQFATTFLLTWAYVRHARLRRDRAALDLRWETQDMARTLARESVR